MNTVTKITTEVVNDTFFDHIVNTAFSNGTGQFIKAVDAVAKIATCHSQNQDFLWDNGIFTPDNNYRSQVDCARKGIYTAFPTHNPVATAVKFVFIETVSTPREVLFDMTPKPFWSHGFIGNTTNLVNTIGYGIGKVYGFGYNIIHESFSFENSIEKVLNTSERFFEKEINEPLPNPKIKIQKFHIPSFYEFEFSFVSGNPFIERPMPYKNIQNIEIPSRLVINNGVGYRLEDSSILRMNPNEVNYNTHVGDVNVNLSLDYGMINHLSSVYIPTIIGNAPTTSIELGNGTNLTISYEMHGISIYTIYTLDNFEKGIHITVNQYHNPNWMDELFIESNYIGIDKIGGFIINNIVNNLQSNGGGVIILENGTTYTISYEMHGISIYKTHTINDPANGIHVGVSEYKNPNWQRDLDNKYNIAFANNFRHVDVLIDGSTITITKEVNRKTITNKFVIDNPHKGIHIEVNEKDDKKYQETAMKQYNSTLQSDTYINQRRLGKLIQTTQGLKPNETKKQTGAFLEKTGEYSNVKIHLWAHRELFFDNELTFQNAITVGMSASYSIIYNIFRGKYKRHNTKLEFFKELTRDSTIAYGETMIIGAATNHLFEEIKFLDLFSLETIGKICPYVSICISSIYQLCKIKFDSTHPHMKYNDINSFIQNRILQTKIGILGKSFTSIITYYGLLEASSLWLIFGGGFVNFSAMIFFNWMITKSTSPYRDVVFATTSKYNRLNEKIMMFNKKIEKKDLSEDEKFDVSVLRKFFEMENIIQPPIQKINLNGTHFIGIGLSYSFGGKF